MTRENLAVRNQFFTPRYVVDWLVQNTLGRRLRQAGYDLDLPLLVGEVGVGSPLALEDVRILDPAVGSGHFLLGCYDLLEQAWKTQRVSPADAAPHILRSLHGIEIDPRASQVAQAVLVLRARQAAPNADLEPPAIATARPLPAAPDVRREVFARTLSECPRPRRGTQRRPRVKQKRLVAFLKSNKDSKLRFAVSSDTPKLDEQDVTADRLERDLVDAIDEITRRADARPCRPAVRRRRPRRYAVRGAMPTALRRDPDEPAIRRTGSRDEPLPSNCIRHFRC